MDLLIAKFGGSVLGGGEDYAAAARHLASLRESGRSPVAVVSAMRGVTSALLRLVEKGGYGEARRIASLYAEALEHVGGGSEERRVLSDLGAELTRILWAVSVVGEASPRVRDHVVAFGERMSALVLAAALRSMGVEAEALSGGEAGIVTTSDYGEASPLHSVSEPLARERLLGMLERGMVPVVAGFTGRTVDGATTLLGRGGSDYTATLLARYLRAGEARLYTDVPGVMTADPRLVPGARVVGRLSFREAMELAYLGAKRFHPRTFEPLVDTGIRVRVTSLGDPEGGTVISGEPGPRSLKAVVVRPDLAVVTVEGAGMVARLGTAAEVMRAAAERGINIVGIMQPVSETTISLIVSGRRAEELAEGLGGLVERGVARRVEVSGGVTASVVGEGVQDSRVVTRLLCRASELDLSLATWFRGDASITMHFAHGDAGLVARRLHEEVVGSG